MGCWVKRVVICSPIKSGLEMGDFDLQNLDKYWGEVGVGDFIMGKYDKSEYVLPLATCPLLPEIV